MDRWVVWLVGWWVGWLVDESVGGSVAWSRVRRTDCPTPFNAQLAHTENESFSVLFHCFVFFVSPPGQELEEKKRDTERCFFFFFSKASRLQLLFCSVALSPCG